MILGQMMDRPLQISSIIEYASEIYGDTEMVSALTDGTRHRQNYRQARRRIIQLAHALLSLGIGAGDRVATLAWNGWRHYELYYATASIGAICHTVNPRLFPDQITYIINHAQDRLIFFDPDFRVLLEGLSERLPEELDFVILGEVPKDSKLTLRGYEELLTGQSETIEWPVFDENTASGLCYSSGTTGDAKGALYSHRSTVLHAMACAIGFQDTFARGRRILPAVPLFHVNAWGLPFSGTLTGGQLVFPGSGLNGPALFTLMDEEKVESAWGVPTVWAGLLAEMEARGHKPEGLAEIVVGGSAAPSAMIERLEIHWDIRVNHAWGMTEMSPIGSLTIFDERMKSLPFAERLAVQAGQGRRMFPVEWKITDPEGKRLPYDGKAFGELHTRAPTVISSYFRNEEASRDSFDAQGWFATGDVARITQEGFLYLVDRSKDLIKSGGEWISSIHLENAACAHEEVAECAVIAREDVRWGERPVLVAVPVAGTNPEEASILALLAQHFAKWQLPDEVIFVDRLPQTATGKISKKTLRAQYGGKKQG